MSAKIFKNKNINILCLSFWTPPIVRPQAILIGKMIPEWIRQGIKPVIVTYEICGNWDINLPIYRIPQKKINLLKKILFNNNYFRNKINEKYTDNIFKFIEMIIKKHNINLIFSFSNPQTSNELGSIIKDRLSIPFISHFSDPWYDNPYRNRVEKEYLEILEKEKKVIETSDRIVFVNNDLKKLVMRKYDVENIKKTITIPHCYETKDYPKKNKKNNKIIFSHIGAVSKQRSPEILFRAFNKVIERDKTFSDKFELHLIGALNVYYNYNNFYMDQLLNKYNLIENNVKILPQVNYYKSLEFMVNSDYLIVIDADIPNSPFLPSKLIDYIGSKTPIIGITPKNSPTNKVLINLGYKNFDYSQESELINYIDMLIHEKIKLKRNNNYAKQFDVKYTTKKLLNTFKTVLSN